LKTVGTLGLEGRKGGGTGSERREGGPKHGKGGDLKNRRATKTCSRARLAHTRSSWKGTGRNDAEGNCLGKASKVEEARRAGFDENNVHRSRSHRRCAERGGRREGGGYGNFKLSSTGMWPAGPNDDSNDRGDKESVKGGDVGRGGREWREFHESDTILEKKPAQWMRNCGQAKRGCRHLGGKT